MIARLVCEAAWVTVGMLGGRQEACGERTAGHLLLQESFDIHALSDVLPHVKGAIRLAEKVGDGLVVYFQE